MKRLVKKPTLTEPRDQGPYTHQGQSHGPYTHQGQSHGPYTHQGQQTHISDLHSLHLYRSTHGVRVEPDSRRWRKKQGIEWKERKKERKKKESRSCWQY